ncbi:MAG TPA: DUF5666 domain-containing protein [Anaerolineae bacterium]|nr:DUF5666 domain-containing protein [Anaerolineae bacterium]HOQ99087.1 DUF5666 domain-containing protein [Anaerolineae bacterium]HPL28386.1 DUF5666 domain-containing protein [Anaerolineae bacterium]HPL28389.1 DUF5666 domain-containing protein [Anaerolineae bacterium]
MPTNILTALEELLLAGMAVLMSLTGAAGAKPARVPNKAIVRQMQSVPRLPDDEVLLVDETGDTIEPVDEGQETEEVSDEELAAPVDIEYVTLRGPISQRPADGVEGIWTVAGRDVQVIAETVVSTRAANAAVGEWAQVQAVGVRTAGEVGDQDPKGAADDGEDQAPLLARSLAVMSSQNKARVVGLIDNMDAGAAGSTVWIVSGVRVRVTAATHILGTPQAGRLADVHGTMAGAEEPQAELEAGLIVVRGTPNLPKQERERVKEHKKLEVTGELEKVDAESGEWVVAGQTVLMNAATRIDEKKGAAEVGAQVRVQVAQDEDGALVALQVEVMRGAKDNEHGQGKAKGNPQNDKKSATPTPDGAEAESKPAKDKPEHGKPDKPSQGKGSTKER